MADKITAGVLEAVESPHPAEATGISRRSLLIQGGMAAVALSLPWRGASALTEAIAAPASEPASRRPLLGALYKADHKSLGEHWAPMGPMGEMPALGLYDSSLEGTMDAHLMMALGAGLSFFMVPYTSTRAIDDGISHLLARSELHGWVKIAVLIEPDEDSRMLARARRSGVLKPEEYVEQAADWLLHRYDAIDRLGWFDHAGYLRDADGRRISGFFGWDSPDVVVQVVERAIARRPALATGHQLWFAGTQDAGDHPDAMARAAELGISWFVLNPELEQGWDRSLKLYRTLSRGSQRVLAVSPAYASAELRVAPRDDGERLASRLEAVRHLRRPPTHVVFNSFNDWRNGTAVEPSLKGNQYLKVIAALSTSWDQSRG